ncbi:MAG: PH domain-containing protein [Acidobacteriota bacterium]
MLDALQRSLHRFMRIPEAPEPPRGDPRSVETFRASRGFYRYRLLAWGWTQATGVIGIVIGLVLLRRFAFAESYLPSEISRWMWMPTALEILFLVLFVLNAAFTWALLTLDFRNRWYMVTDRSLRIREGLWTIRERTMTFSNVQNISVRQGPVQRLFGIADLRVQSAGGGSEESGSGAGSKSDNLHVGVFRGVDNAEQLRDLILDYQRRGRSGDLATAYGDEAAPEAATATQEDGPEAADSPLSGAAELLAEARALRRALARGGPGGAQGAVGSSTRLDGSLGEESS